MKEVALMKTRRDIFDIFMQDENYKYIMKRLLEASIEESFNLWILNLWTAANKLQKKGGHQDG